MDGAQPDIFTPFGPVRDGDVPIVAGFECGRLHWSGHDLLHSTDHLPQGGMAHHYATAIAQGARGGATGCRGAMTSWRGCRRCPRDFR